MADKVKVIFEIDDKLALKAIQQLTKATDKFADNTVKALKDVNSRFNIFIGNLAVQGVVRGLEFLGNKLKESFDLAKEFETGLIEVAKTSNLTGKELAVLTKEVDKLAEIIPVSTKELLANSKVAGQLGVEGVDNILKYATAIAKLGRVSDIQGEAAASSIARIINVTQEGNDTVETFASVIVSLGNNFAATESEIIRVTNEIARATAQFGVSAAEAAALSATLRAIGVRAEEAGTVIGKSFRAIEKAINTGGKELKQLERITGDTGDELRKQFGDDAIGVFQKFIVGVQRLKKEGAILAGELATIGLSGERVQKVLPALSANAGELERALRLANIEVKDATALNIEFERSLESTDSQLQLLNNAIEKVQRNLGEKFADAFKIVNPLLLDFVKGLAETEEETFIRQTDDVKRLGKELVILRNKLAGILADGKISFFEADPEEIARSITLIQEKLEAISTEETVTALATLREELLNLQGLKLLPIELQVIIPGEQSVDSRIDIIKEKIENLDNFLAVRNETLKATEEASNEEALAREKNKFDALRLLKEANIESDIVNRELDVEAAKLADEEDFITLSNNLGRREAARVIARATDLANEGKLALAKEKVGAAVEKSDRANKRREIALAQKTTNAQVQFAQAAGSAIVAISGKQGLVQFALMKAIAFGGAIVLGRLAVAQAAAAAPPPGNVALIAAAEKVNAFNLATIAAASVGELAQGFQFGGFVGGPRTGDKNRIGVNGDEAILTPSQQRRFMDIANGVEDRTGNSEMAAALNNLADAMRVDKVVNISGREVFRSVQNELDSGSEFTSIGA